MAKRSDSEYEEDLFSLEEEENRERRKQTVQYVIVAICAAAVVALALFGTVKLTQRRMANQEEAEKVTAKTPAVILPASVQETNFWPADDFPQVPVLEAEGYDTKSETGRAVVEVPAQTAASFGSYVDQLIEEGARLWIDTDRLKVLDLNGTEVHLVDSNNRTAVTMCSEPVYNWNDSVYSAFLKPDARLVKVEEGAGADSRILTYRGASPMEALEYTQALNDGGWSLNGSMEMKNGVFQAVFKKNNLQITVDYFSSKDDYQVRLDFLN
ncbi:MAG: hypothetical protein IKE30_04900 [Clostridia bacterium]|nr:hypothetical protein [Clostridia bacterium]